MSATAASVATDNLCGNCRRRGARFVLQGMGRCLFCTLRHRPLLKRSVLTALVVGTILTAINQGNILVHGEFPAVLAWKIPLTYCVPFCVATWGALINSRLPAAVLAFARGNETEAAEGQAEVRSLANTDGSRR